MRELNSKVTHTSGGYKRENKSTRSLGILRIVLLCEAAATLGSCKVGSVSWVRSLSHDFLSQGDQDYRRAGKGTGSGLDLPQFVFSTTS